MKITINSKTSGKFKNKMLNNREHLVTDMVPIVGNSIMNRGFYPLDEIEKSHQQLHFLPAPNGHPKVNDQLVSAFHPLAVNSFNIGGMVRNPKMDGDKVVNEFWLDLDVANQSSDGKELIKRIKNGEEVGVSTGLNAKRDIVNEKGKGFDWVARDLQFDHVAILLNEAPAGDQTRLANSEDNLAIVNCAILGENFENKEPNIENAITGGQLQSDLRALLKPQFPNDFVYIMTMFPLDRVMIFEVESKTTPVSKLFQQSFTVDTTDTVSLNDDRIEVVKKVVFEPVSGDANSINNSLKEDETMTDKVDKGKKVIANANDETTLTVESAIKLLESKGLMVNKKEDDPELQYFIQNKSSITAMIKEHEGELTQLRSDLIANSDLEEADVKDMSKDMLVKLSNSIKPVQDYSLRAGGKTELKVVNSADIPDDAFEDDYTSISQDKGVK